MFVIDVSIYFHRFPIEVQTYFHDSAAVFAILIIGVLLNN